MHRNTQHSQKENKYTRRQIIKVVSLVAQSVKNLPAKQETSCNAGDLSSIPALGRSLGKEMANHSNIPARKFHGQSLLVGKSQGI